MRLSVAADARAAAQEAAAWIAERLRAALAARGRARIAFSGGLSPRPMLEALAALPLPWQDVDAFQVDERVVRRHDAARNLAMLVAALPQARWHPMPVDAVLDGERVPAAAARDYACLLEAQAGEPAVLDVVHLGLGEDGHTASLFPGDAALDVLDADVVAVGERLGHSRMSCTLPLLSRARARAWLVTGVAKAPMLAALLAGDARIPAARVATTASVVFADAAAAGRTPRGEP